MQRRATPGSRLVDVLPASPKVSAKWNPFSLFVVDATPLRASIAFCDLALGLYTAGRHRIRRRMGRRVVEGWSDPGTFNMTPPNVDGSWEAEGSSHAIVLTIPPAYLSRVISEHWEADPRGVEIVPQFLARDRVIEAVMTRLALKAHHGSHSDTLYVASACDFLAHHIVDGYSSLSKSEPRYSGGLGRRLNAVVDYIEANLAGPITLRDLAGLAGVSARHFERAFRQSLELPPHAYVLRRRVDAARDLLVGQGALTMAQIAKRVGFSSASHLASAFRRHQGYSPTQFRRIHSQS
ncbi:MAG: AraC family transcriptional regulator [Myxococcales bacterium]|jgi:AraC family transcriptional regulator|nr:AraC family transcriptional regulator [Myxococcales bacterium]